MRISAIIPTRSKQLSDTTKSLSSFLFSAGINVCMPINKGSIFEAHQSGVDYYKKAAGSDGLGDDDIFILCHDDIKLRGSSADFKKTLTEALSDPSVGFVGPAGTKLLSENAVWWDQAMWKQGHHRGAVYHYDKNAGREYLTEYGRPGQVVVLDGLFLAATKKTLDSVSLEKPPYLVGDWDFYDLHYTMTAHQMGLKNMVIPMNILHNSIGELVGRDSWHNNRKAFINHFDLPCQV